MTFSVLTCDPRISMQMSQEWKAIYFKLFLHNQCLNNHADQWGTGALFCFLEVELSVYISDMIFVLYFQISVNICVQGVRLSHVCVTLIVLLPCHGTAWNPHPDQMTLLLVITLLVSAHLSQMTIPLRLYCTAYLSITRHCAVPSKIYL